jgi:CubicO group peptidase (beta-lactamase class C family)
MKTSKLAVLAILVSVSMPACVWAQAAPPPARTLEGSGGWASGPDPSLFPHASGGSTGQFTALLKPFVDNHAMAGAVTLVADKQKVLSLEAVGYEDLAAKQLMRTNCLFWIASQSKPITAAALMILVDEGKLKIEDPVEKYLPEFRGQMVAEKKGDQVLLRRPRHPITVRNVLSHTSGLPFKSPIEEPTLDLYPLALRVRSYAMLPLDFEPDTKYQYSNAGINTAGRLIEVLSGMSYEKFLDERLLKPLGMHDTTFWPNAEQLKRLAKAYRPTKNGFEECHIEQLKYPLDDPARQPMPAGGLFSTASDVSLFYRMIANEGQWGGKRILSAEAVRTMTSKQTGDLPAGYGLGIAASGRFVEHGGAYNTSSRLDRERGIITVFLGQHAAWGPGGDKIIPTFQNAAEAFFK